jgi:hypothetical protein
MFPESIKEGHMQIRTGALGSWKDRYFVLFSDKMWYFASRYDDNISNLKGEIRILPQTVVSLTETNGRTISIVQSAGDTATLVRAGGR